MSPQLAALPPFVVDLIGLVVFALLVFAVVELRRWLGGSSVEAWLKERLARIWKAQRDPGEEPKQDAGDQPSSEQKRKSRSPIIGFPVSAVALVLLGVMALVFTLYGWTVFQGPATLDFSASFDEASPAVTGATTADPTVGMVIPAHAMLKQPGKRLSDSAVVISAPETIALSDCYAHTSDRKFKGYARGPQARISLGDLGSSDAVEVECSISVVHRIRHLETVTLELTAANYPDAQKRFLSLVPPDVELAQETAEDQADKEIRASPALWRKSSMNPAKNGFKELGEEWPRINPQYLHGFMSEPHGRTTTLQHLDGTRVESSKIMTLKAVITSPLVTEERFRAKGSERQAIRQVFAIGEEAGERGGWCTTTRSTSQPPLREGEHIELRAAVVEWGRSAASGGIAVMLNCPAVKVLGVIGKVARGAGSGAVAAPSHRGSG